MMGRFVLALAAAWLAAAPAGAQLGPKKASDIVHAFVQDAQPCPGFPQSQDRFSHRLLPDVTLEPLVVPPKKVLIVRHVEVGTSNQTPGASGLVSIIAGNGTEYTSYVTRAITLDAAGSARLEIDLPIGFPVPAGASVCIHNTLTDVQFGGNLEGYFAPAK